jgi:hypothetical protein
MIAQQKLQVGGWAYRTWTAWDPDAWPQCCAWHHPGNTGNCCGSIWHCCRLCDWRACCQFVHAERVTDRAVHL